jgi:hypothetical protein
MVEPVRWDLVDVGSHTVWQGAEDFIEELDLSKIAMSPNGATRSIFSQTAIFNQAAPYPADSIKCLDLAENAGIRKRRQRSKSSGRPLTH